MKKIIKDKLYVYLLISIIATTVILTLVLNIRISNLNENVIHDPGISQEEKEFVMDIQRRVMTEADIVANELIDIINTLENSQLTREDRLKLGQAYFGYALANLYLDNTQESIKYYKRTIDYFSESNNYFYILNSFNELARLYYSRNDFANSITVANEMYNILEKAEVVGISVIGQDSMKVNALSILTVATINLDLLDSAKVFYSELIELINKNPEHNTDMAIFAKFAYNMAVKNDEKTEKYALEYVDYLEKSDKDNGTEISDAGYVYLVEYYVETMKYDKVPELISKLEDVYKVINQGSLFATLDRIKGSYALGTGDYYGAIEYYEKSIQKFNEVNYSYYEYDLYKRIINIISKNKLNIDIDKYLENYLRLEKEHGSLDVIGNIADTLINTINSINDVKELENNKEKQMLNKINSIARNMNFIFLIVIIILGVILYKLKLLIEEKKEKEKVLCEMVNTDYLTKAFSKQFTYDKIENNIIDKKEFYIAMLDIDHFKKINDTFGHLFGDEVLVVLIRLIKETIEGNGFVGRYGGEEFVVVINNMNVDISSMMNEISIKLKSIKWKHSDLKVTISIGVTKSNSENIDDLIDKVDKLLYESKKERDKITISIE